MSLRTVITARVPLRLTSCPCPCHQDETVTGISVTVCSCRFRGEQRTQTGSSFVPSREACRYAMTEATELRVGPDHRTPAGRGCYVGHVIGTPCPKWRGPSWP